MKAKSILVLEHDVSDFSFIVKELSALGYSENDFFNCTSLKQLSDRAVANFSPDFIFANLNLPDSPSAIETFLTTQRLFPEVPIVVLADLIDDEVAGKCLELGAQNYVEKRAYTGSHLLKTITYSIERNLAQLELKRLKADYQNLFDENPLPLLLVSNDSLKFIDVNKAAIDKYGYSKNEFAGLALADIVYSRSDNDGKRREEPLSPFSTHYKKNGESFYVEVKATPIIHRNIPAQLLTVTDRTEKVLAEEKEKKARQRLDAIFNGTHDLILLADDMGRYVQVNRRACFELEYTEDELLSLSVSDILISSKAKYEQLWDDFLQKEVQTGIVELRAKSGKTLLCHYNATASVLPGLHLCILADVTQQEYARKKIELQGKRIENILDSIKDWFFFVDKDWIVRYWNKAAEQLFPREDVLGRNLWEVYKDAVDMKVYRALHQVMEHQKPVRLEDEHHPSGRWFDISVYPASDGITVYFKDITTAKKQEQELVEAKNNLATLINSTNDLIWSIDTNMKLVLFNDAYKKTIEEFGILVEEGMQLPFQYQKNGLVDQWKIFYERGLAGEAFSEVIQIQNPKTGNIKHAELSFIPIYAFGTTTVKALACFSHNITQSLEYQKLIEEQNQQLRANEEHLKKLTARLEKVMSSSLDIICSLTADGTFTQVSEASKNILGYSSCELTGRHYQEVIDPKFEEATRQAFEEAMLGKPFTNFQNAYIHKNGHSVPLIWSKNWDEEEQIMFCVARDGSSVIEAEKLKAESEQRFTALVQKGADMIGIIDAAGNIKYASPNLDNVVGHKSEQMVGQNALSLIHPDDVPLAVSELQKVAAGGEVKLAAFRYKGANGEWRWFETIATNMLDNPAINGIVINSRDITRRKEIEAEREQMIKELLKSNSDLKQFSFITSHNLRAPLSNIRGILNIIDYAALDPFNRQMIDMIDTSSKQLGQTIDDLAKILIIKNNVNLEIARINLPDAINEINKVFLNTLNDVCASISTDFKVNDIFFNKVYFESILVNLLSNAIKYRSLQRNLEIKVTSEEASDGSVILKFCDNGSGMDVKMHKNKLFGLYQRFHEKTEGQGLGLFIIKSQIVALGGRIDVESEPDKGTTFTIIFKNHYDVYNKDETKEASEVNE